MTDYSQPSFYRFNEDSLKLVKYVSGKISRADNILDLGAGTGVMGIELSNRLKPTSLTLVELQPEFLPHLTENTKKFLSSEIGVNIILNSFGEWNPPQKYDLVICNPPYYLPGHGQKNLDPQREKARSFVHDSWPVLMELIWKSLTDSGRAFLVIKNDPRILELARHEKLSVEKYESDGLVFLQLSRLEINGSQDLL